MHVVNVIQITLMLIHWPEELPERPKTAARQKPADEDEFNNTELGEDLLPE